MVSPPAPNLKRNAAGSAKSGENLGELSKADQKLFLALTSSDFVLSCVLGVEEVTPTEYPPIERLVEDLTGAIERNWCQLALQRVSLRPGLQKLSDVTHLISDFVAEKAEGDPPLSTVLRNSLAALPVSFCQKMHHKLRSMMITFSNAMGACLLLLYGGKPENTHARALLLRIGSADLGPTMSWMYFVLARHMLDLPMRASAFEALSREVATALLKKYGHPSSWCAYRKKLQQMQTDTERFWCKAHDDMLVIFCNFELHAGVPININIDRNCHNFLLNTVVLGCIRNHFVKKEAEEKEAALRARLQQAVA